MVTDVLERAVETHGVAASCLGPRLAPGTELLGEYKDGAFTDPQFLVRRPDGQVMQLPRLLYRVAASLDGRPPAEIAAELSAEFGRELTAEQISFLVDERLRPFEVIASDDVDDGAADDGPAPVHAHSDPLLGMRYRLGVVPASVAWRLAGVFRLLFARSVWPVLVAAFLAVDAWILLEGDLLGAVLAGVGDVGRRPGLVLTILALTMVAAAFHECGHITACRYGGARPGDVGVGIYIVWPAFYSTVTDSYRLDRVGRLRTDLGGVYFDAVFMAVVGLLYLRTGETWLLLALIGMHVETAWQFLPSIRLDGYYILADLVGVPDLFAYMRPVLLGLLPGRPTHPKVLALKKRARRVLVLWVAAVVPSLLFWVVVVLLALPRLLPAAWAALQHYLQTLDAAARAGDLLTTTVGATELAFLVLPWVGGALVCWSTTRLLAGHLAGRTALRRIPAGTWSAVRRGVTLSLLVGTGVLLVARVASVTLSHPGTTGEVRLAESALAAARGLPGPPVGGGDLLARTQVTLYAQLTGAFERHASVLAGGREIVVVAAALLVACLVALVAARRLTAAGAALPLVAVLAMGPAVTTLATLGPGTLGAAWVAVGAVVVTLVRGRTGVLVGLGAIAAGVATAPLVALPLAAGVGVLLGAGRFERNRRAGVHEGPRHAAPSGGKGEAGRWAAVALALPACGLGTVVAGGPSGMPLTGPERTMLLLLAAVVVAGALAVPRLRAPAVATATAVALAVQPWNGAAGALPAALVAAALAAALLCTATGRTSGDAPVRPWLKGCVASCAVLLTVAGALFLPLRAPGLPHAALAAWLTGPSAPAGALAVPAGLWGDLVRDGVPADRLVRDGGRSDDVDLLVRTGQEASAGALATFGSGDTTLAVVPAPPSDADRRMAAAEARAAAAEQADARAGVAERQSVGSLLVDAPRLAAPAEVRALLRDGRVDSRVLVVLGELVRQHQVTVSDLPPAAGEDPALPRHRVVVTRWDGRAVPSDPDAAALLTGELRAWQPPLAPVDVSSGRTGITIDWTAAPAPRPGQ
ncbi:hypothetical protein [Geodermatophilus sp. URMC 64]